MLDEMLLHAPKDVSPYKGRRAGNTWESKYPMHQWYRRMLALQGKTMKDAAMEYGTHYITFLRLLDKPPERMWRSTRQRLAKVLGMDVQRMLDLFRQWEMEG